MSNTIDLTLDGLSCGHCVKRVKESLEQRPDVEQAEVTLTEAHVTGSASAQALIDTVKQASPDFQYMCRKIDQTVRVFMTDTKH